jgi:hypothetical protein
MKKILTLLLAFAAITCYSQKTLRYDDTKVPPAAKINELAWMAGTWQGTALGGFCEEIWSTPQGGSMMFCFRMVKNGQVAFYELGHIKEQDGSLVLELKHFDEGLTGWEEKDGKEVFELVKIEKDKVCFDGFTIERKSADNIIMYVLMEDSGKELPFDYKRAK